MTRSSRRRKKSGRSHPHSSHGAGHGAGHGGESHTMHGGAQMQIIDVSRQAQERLHWFVVAVLLLFGVYMSVLYFGHQMVPNSDFTAFVDTGKSILSFQRPASFKRLPMLGMMQVILSRFVGGAHPELTAGWLLNAILHPLNLLLLYLIARKTIGRSAPWFAVIAIINPWVLKWMNHPIAETTLLFFILLALYFILLRSKWCYLFVMMAAMVRYEAAALIVVAFVMDMIDSKTHRQRLVALVLSGLASIPLAVWMLYTFETGKTGSTSGHYITHYGHGSCMGDFLQYLWMGSVGALFAAKSAGVMGVVNELSRFLLVVSVIVGLCYGLYKRKWGVLAVLLFVAPYVLVHGMRSATQQRYCVPIMWAVLLLCWYGFVSAGDMIGRLKIPRPIVWTFCGVVAITAVIWLSLLLPAMSKTTDYYSPRSLSVPYAAMAVVAVFFAAGTCAFKKQHLAGRITLSALTCLMIVSSQFTLVRALGKGTSDGEFKMLAEWYIKNAEPGEKLATSMPHVVGIYMPDHKQNLISTSRISGEELSGFAQGCRGRGVTYLAWDSRIGFSPQNSYYRRWRMERIAALWKKDLRKNEIIGPFELIDQIRLNSRFINIFRLRTAPSLPPSPAQPSRGPDQ